MEPVFFPPRGRKHYCDGGGWWCHRFIIAEKTDLVKNKAGRIVSKKRSALGKKNSWIVACNKARAFLKIKGFTVIKKGTPLYKKAKEFLA